MVNVVLVHGAMHGAWCWERTVPFLEADPRVDRVFALDLPGHGDKVGVKPTEEITLDDYVAEAAAAIEGDDLRDVVLVGHSLAGITITPAANRVADRLVKLVYLTTVCPSAGETAMDALSDRGASPVGEIPDIFCTDFDAATREWLVGQLCEQPMGPMLAPATVDTPPADVPATYIVCERDEAISASRQREQAAQVGAAVVSIDAGHSPFATHPEELAALILDGV